MFALVLRRTQMADVLSGGHRTASRQLLPLDHPTLIPRLEPLSVAAIWSRHPSEHPALPEYLLTADDHERDWLAWLVTFAPTLRPFTAYCHVMSLSHFAELFEAFQTPDLGELENACLGLILGEVLSSEDVLTRPTLPFSAGACASVLSFPLVRELALYRLSVLDPEALPLRWSTVRQLTRQRMRGLNPAEVVRVAGVVRGLLRHHDPMSATDFQAMRGCRELQEFGEIVSSVSDFNPILDGAARAMQGTREERVAVFEHALAAAMMSEPRDESFALGYLASRINPGTLSHAGLLAPALHRHPSAMLWYGICAGLSRETNVAGELGGIGRRVLRDLLAPESFVGRPRSDISATELEILLAGERAEDFPVASPSHLSVELAPGISTIVNWSSRIRSRRMLEDLDRPSDMAWVEQELGAAIQRLTDMYRRLRGSDPHEGGPEQARLFERPVTRKGTKRR